MPEQSFANHTKTFPPFHFFLLPMLLVNLGSSVYSLVFWGWRGRYTFASFLGVLMALALIAGFFSARIFALTVQDRVIRLEERLRYARLLPADLQPRIGEFTVDQIVSLRFASDEELPALARKVLDEKPADRKAIKRLITNWKPDNLRA
jgi:hypothetical protein